MTNWSTGTPIEGGEVHDNDQQCIVRRRNDPDESGKYVRKGRRAQVNLSSASLPVASTNLNLIAELLNSVLVLVLAEIHIPPNDDHCSPEMKIVRCTATGS